MLTRQLHERLSKAGVAVHRSYVGEFATSTEMTAARGAAWVGDRSRGIADAGATAYLRFLEALKETSPARIA